MKAAVFRRAGWVEVLDVPTPEIGPLDVLVQVHYCGLCGSDLEAYHTGMYEPNLIIGHEFSGEVLAVGDRVYAWHAGERVTVDDAIPCGRCPACRRGQMTLCEDLLMPGVTLDGGMAEFVTVPERALHRLPEGVDTRQGALVEPLAVALRGVRSSALRPGDRALVMGAGPIGLLTLQCARLAGARTVYVSEVNPTRANLAERLGADAVWNPRRDNLAVELASRTRGEGPEVIYICTGARSALESAVTLVGKGGQIIVLGLPVEPVAADFFTMVLHELQVRGSYLGCGEFPAAMDYVAQGRVDVEALISHEIRLDDIVARGFEMLEAKDTEAVKVLVDLTR